jgi:hypothetical protein
MIEFSTDDLPLSERFDAFQEFITRLSRTETRRLDEPAAQPFRGKVSVTPLGHISFSTLAGTPTRYWCLPGSERFRPDYLRLMVNRAGSAIVSQYDQDASFTQTGATIFDNRACGATHYAETYTTYAYNVPRSLMLAAAPNADAYSARPVQANPRILSYLISYTDAGARQRRSARSGAGNQHRQSHVRPRRDVARPHPRGRRDRVHARIAYHAAEGDPGRDRPALRRSEPQRQNDRRAAWS